MSAVPCCVRLRQPVYSGRPRWLAGLWTLKQMVFLPFVRMLLPLSVQGQGEGTEPCLHARSVSGSGFMWTLPLRQYPASRFLIFDNLTCSESWYKTIKSISLLLPTDRLLLCFKSKQDWSSISSRVQGNCQAAEYLWPCFRPLLSWIPLAAKRHHEQRLDLFHYQRLSEAGIYVFYICDGASGYCKHTIMNYTSVRWMSDSESECTPANS